MTQTADQVLIQPPKDLCKLEPNTRDFLEWINGGELRSPKTPVCEGAKPSDVYPWAIGEKGGLVAETGPGDECRQEILGLLKDLFFEWYPFVTKEKEIIIPSDEDNPDDYYDEEPKEQEIPLRRPDLNPQSIQRIINVANRHLSKASIRAEFVSTSDEAGQESYPEIIWYSDHHRDASHWPWFMLIRFLQSKDLNKLKRCYLPSCHKLFIRSGSNQDSCCPEHAKEFERLWRQQDIEYKQKNQERVARSMDKKEKADENSSENKITAERIRNSENYKQFIDDGFEPHEAYMFVKDQLKEELEEEDCGYTIRLPINKIIL